MCNRDCCAMKTALQIRHLKKLLEKQKQADIVNPPKIVPTSQSQIYTYDHIQSVANYIIRRTRKKPKFGLICGCNLEMLVDLIEMPIVINYGEIPKFPSCRAYGHAGKLFVGTLFGATVMGMQGRFHYYEGNQLAKSALLVRVMKLCGVEYLFDTCSAAAVNLNYQVGDIVLIMDHINMYGVCGHSPLNGPNDERFGSRHTPMRDAYDRILLQKGQEIGQEIGYERHMHTGIYACYGGPFYETAAEHNVLRQIGVDVVGMSIVHEVIVARHCGMKVFAFSLITVPCLENAKYADRSLKPGQDVCLELLSRLIYYIENDLINISADADKLTVGKTGYAEETFHELKDEIMEPEKESEASDTE